MVVVVVVARVVVVVVVTAVVVGAVGVDRVGLIVPVIPTVGVKIVYSTPRSTFQKIRSRCRVSP